MAHTHSSDILVIGGGPAGIVTALEALRQGQRVTLVDRDTPERLGGLALWAFGGMALVGTPLQARMKIPDTPETPCATGCALARLAPDDTYPSSGALLRGALARQVYDWLIGEGVKFMPAVNWVERGMQGDGNSRRATTSCGAPRANSRAHDCADARCRQRRPPDGAARPPRPSSTTRAGAWRAPWRQRGHGRQCACKRPVVVLAMGGINGGHAETRRNWPRHRPRPQPCSTAPTLCRRQAAPRRCDTWGQITHAGEMWNYAAGFPHPFPHFEGHGPPPFPASRRCGSTTGRAHRPRAAGDRL